MREKQAADEGWPLYYSIPGFKWWLHMECGPCALVVQVFNWVLRMGCGPFYYRGPACMWRLPS